MNKKLPDIFANPIDKKMGNTQEMYYGNDRISSKVDHRSIEQKINHIFSARDFVYKRKVRIELPNSTKVYTIVGKTDKSLLTIDNETILMKDILDIEAI